MGKHETPKTAVILAGGKGTRLLPLTLNIPKPLVEVAGHPFLYWQLRYLRDQGITDALLLVSHMAEKIQDYFQRNPMKGMNLRFSVEPVPMGTGGALARALPHLPERFWLLNGDSFLRVNLAVMAKAFDSNGWRACIATVGTELVSVPGNLKLEKSLVTGYVKEGGKEPGYSDVDAGVYLISKSAVEAGARGTFDLGALWPPLIAKHELGSFRVNERYFDIGTLERLKTFEKDLRQYFEI